MAFGKSLYWQDSLRIQVADAKVLRFASQEESSSDQSIDTDTQKYTGKNWPSGRETKSVRGVFADHLSFPVDANPTEGMFIDFEYSTVDGLIPVFARIACVYENPIRYDFDIPRIDSHPTSETLPEGSIIEPILYYFTIPIFAVESEYSQLIVGKEKINDAGFVLVRPTDESNFLYQSYPTFQRGRNKLPWVVVVSSRWFDRQRKRDKFVNMREYLIRMTLADNRVIVNYQPFAGKALKDELGFNLQEEKKFIREAHDLNRLLVYLEDDFEKFFKRPVSKIFES